MGTEEAQRVSLSLKKAEGPMTEPIPAHLSPFIVEQPYGDYTAIDQAVWRYVMRQNVAFHRDHAHAIYLEGLKASGIAVEEIPRIETMNDALSRFGWRAVAVDGFIPPAAFMEFQARGILPIACDMRSLAHLSYTPAPDIIHESAGHAPILSDPGFTAFVKTLCELGSQALSTPEDDALYEAIRLLSIVKETPGSTPAEIREAEERLKVCQAAIGTVSQANMVSRLYWWTVEYGLIGPLDQPRIYGAGLLSSVGESQRVFTDAVAKIPFDLDVCIATAYDITSYQPQLFVCESFEQLTAAVHVLAERMGLPLGRMESAEAGVPVPPRVSSRSSQDTPEKAYPTDLIALYQAMRDLRAEGREPATREPAPREPATREPAPREPASREAALRSLLGELERFPDEWLLRLEWLELASRERLMPDAQERIRHELERLSTEPDRRELIANGLALIGPAPARSLL
jgi:phenylalanine-4-hydroxylase